MNYTQDFLYTNIVNGESNYTIIPNFKAQAYVNYIFDSSGVTILTNGLPNYEPSLFGNTFDNVDINDLTTLEWNSIYKSNNLSRDSNNLILKFNCMRYRISFPDHTLKDIRSSNNTDYGYLTNLEEIGFATNGVALYNSFVTNTLYIEEVSTTSYDANWNTNSLSQTWINRNYETTLLDYIIAGNNVYYPDGINFADQYSSCCGHNSDTQYHYNKLPYCLNEGPLNTDSSGNNYYSNVGEIYTFYKNNNDNNKHSPIIGWLLDGFPVYGPIGYKYIYNDDDTVSISTNSSGIYETVFKKSSYDNNGYSLNQSVVNYTHNSQLSYHIGYNYNSNYTNNDSDSDGIYLDYCNGIYGPTPEFPDGIYHYHATISIDSSGEPIKGIDYFYPYDIDNCIQLNEDVLNYISTIITTIPDDLNINSSWTTWINFIYSTSSTNENTSMNVYTAIVYYPDNSDEFNLYNSYYHWTENNLQGGLLSFWLRDQGSLGYTYLKTNYSSVFDKFESILPAFPYITNIFRGNVDVDENKYSTKNEVTRILYSSSEELKDEWKNAFQSIYQ